MLKKAIEAFTKNRIGKEGKEIRDAKGSERRERTDGGECLLCSCCVAGRCCLCLPTVSIVPAIRFEEIVGTIEWP